MSRLLSRYAIERFDCEVFSMPTFPRLIPNRHVLGYVVAAVGCTILADFLFYDRAVGISLVVFFTAIAAVSACLNARPGRVGPPWVAVTVFVASQLPMIEDFDLLPCLFAVIGLATFVVTARRGRSIAVRELLPLSVIVILSGFARSLVDFARLIALGLRRRKHPITGNDFATWLVPLGVGVVFLILFRAANPLIDEWIARIDLSHVLNRETILRGTFWIAIFIAIWPAIRVRVPRGWMPRRGVAASRREPRRDGLVGQVVMKRSLILFNALFAVQTGMDLVYLWGGATLPHGMTYATYAHRGAYPLMATALLAAAFVLIALRSSQHDRATRALLLAWVGQNILLVLSSIFRLNLYVAAYSLTALRIHAFIWMLLVAVGLGSIVVRIVWNKSSTWLVGANAAALVLALYGCCFVDFPTVIVRYNLHHARECGGDGPPLDTAYLQSLPPHALLGNGDCPLPEEVEWYRDDWIAAVRSGRPNWRRWSSERWVAIHLAYRSDWRAWSFRQWRIERALANLPPSP